MKSKAINFLLFLACLAAIALILTQPAHATGQVDPASSVASSTASAGAKASAGASSAIDLSLATNPVQSYRGGESYALAAPASAAPLPPGLCPKGDSESYSIVWGFVSWSKSSTRTEMECLEKVLQMMRDTKPSTPAINYLAELKQDPKPLERPATESVAPAVSCAAAKPNPPAPKKHVKKPMACGK